MKKIICLFVVCIMAIGLLTACGPNEVEEKPEVVLNIKTPFLQMTSLTDEEISNAYAFLKKASNAFTEQYKDANVTINLSEFSKENQDKEIPGSYDTDNATDVLYAEFFNMSTYIHSGRVVPLDDIISEDIRNDIDSSYWDNSTLNGKTYMIPYLGMQNTLAYNKELFRQVGLEKYISDKDEIQSWTLDEWETILSTLKEKLPENVFPMMMYAKNSMGDTHIMTLLRSRGGTFFDENGRIDVNTPEGIAAIQWIMDANEKGYFPTNAETLEIDDCGALFYNQQLAISLNNIALDVSLRQHGFEYGNVNFPSVDGKGFNTTFITGFEVFDNGDEEKLKVAKDFVKYIYETDEWLDYSSGGITCSNKVAEKYKDQLVNEKKYIDNKPNGWNFTNNAPAWRDVRAAFYPNIQDLLYGELTAEEIAKQINETCNKAIEDGYANSVLHE